MAIHNIELQGSVNSPLRCSITTDTLGKTLLSSCDLSKILYKFTGFLMIPPLAVIDYLVTITNCGVDSLLMHALVKWRQNALSLVTPSASSSMWGETPPSVTL